MELRAPGARYRGYALSVVTAVYALNFVDRGLMVILLQPIKQDLQLSDTQLGFVTGLAFGLFYAVLGLPIARWADRGNRVSITSIAIGLWGLTMIASSFIGSYMQLVAARIAAAVGEAGCKPPTYSLVGDYFPEPAARTRAMSIYWMASPIAGLVSYVAGGWLNELYGWRTTFLIMGVPGLLLATLVRLTIKEPRDDLPAGARPPLPSMASVFERLWRQRSCRNLCIGLIVFYTMSLGLSPWYGAFMMRSHGMGTAELGTWFGSIVAVAGIAGVLAGGYVTNRWFAGDEPGQMRLIAAAVAALLPCFVAFLTLHGKHQAMAAFVPLIIAFTFLLAPIYALMQRLVPDNMRATMMSVIMLLANLVGMGLGPQFVGIVSDLLAPAFGADSLRFAMLGMSGLALWAAYHFLAVARSVKADLASVEATSWPA